MENKKSYKQNPSPVFVSDTERRIRIAQATNLAIQVMWDEDKHQLSNLKEAENQLDDRVKFFNEKLKQYFADKEM